MRSVESKAKTMEEAVTQGLEKLGVSIADVTIDVVDGGSKGFLGLLGGKPVIVRLTVREDAETADEEADEEQKPVSVTPVPVTEKASPESAEKPLTETKPKSSPKPRAPKTNEPVVKPAMKLDTSAAKPAQKPAAAAVKPVQKPAVPAVKPARKPETPTAQPTGTPVEPAPLCDPDTLEGKAQDYMMNVTRLMGLNISVGARVDEEGNVRVNMHGDTQGVLIGRRGETLDALQYLTSLYVNKGREGYTRVTLDTENYRERREEALTRLANRMANRAVKTGRKVVMEPMNPYERRILHSALQQNEHVATHSEGEEPNRHVVITLK